ncbi:hypothetical protein LUZ60_002831 [Juncus effusus]|nr:hypothetical protein LUZ60_002831 [Juncus effusus]
MGGFGDQVWLMQTNELDEKTRTFINPIDGSIEKREIPEMQGKLLLGSFGEWLVLADEETDECFLLNLSSQSKIDLPPISEPFESLGECNLSSSPTSPDCTIIFVGVGGIFLLFCNVYCEEWTKMTIGYTTHGRARNVVCKGKLYIPRVVDIIIIDVASLFTSNVEITKIYTPRCEIDSAYIHYLVESCGDLYVVSAILATENSVLHYVQIHRLVFSEDEDLEWVQSIREGALLLGENNVALLCPDGCGLEHDCIYYVSKCHDGGRLYKISLIDQTISFTLIPTNTFMWVVPTRLQSTKHEKSMPCSLVDPSADAQLVAQEEDKSTNDIYRSWADLPVELVESFSKYLCLNEFRRLPVVCKQWRSLSNPIRDAKVWLMYCPKWGDNHDICDFFDPLEGQKYTAKIKQRICHDQTRLRFSKDGWVLVSIGSYALVLLNPFTEDIIFLPIVGFQYCKIAFSSVPTSPDCVVIKILGPYGGEWVSFGMCRLRDDEWCHMEFNNNPPFYACSCPPVFFQGEFYCLGNTGGLGVFNPDKKTWRVLDKPRPIHLQQPEMGTEYCYLMESRGELISIFRGIATPYVRVFKLDQSKMDWVKLNDLGDVAIFVAGITSFAKISADRRCKNKIHFPRLHDGCNNGKGEFYCMKRQKYTPNFNNVKAPYNCVWLEPKLDGHERNPI